MLQLHNLEKLTKKRKRVGRGGDRGGLSGRGRDGQKGATGSTSEISATFEGGQMPLVRRLPRRGFNNFEFRKEYHIVNLIDLDRNCDSNEVVDKKIMIEKGLLKAKKGSKCFIKVLGNGELTKKLVVHADAFSASAVAAIEKVGGKTHLIGESARGSVAS